MHYLFIPFFAALQVCFLYLLFRFLGKSKRNLAEIICIHLIAWFAISLFSYFDFPGIYGYSVYLFISDQVLDIELDLIGKYL